jgi:hypothetical protein
VNPITRRESVAVGLVFKTIILGGSPPFRIKEEVVYSTPMLNLKCSSWASLRGDENNIHPNVFLDSSNF